MKWQARQYGLSVLLCISGMFVFISAGAAQDDLMRRGVKYAEEAEARQDWETARETYEKLLGQRDPGLGIRDRYHNAVRRCWQLRRHQDVSYRKEVLSIEYSGALRLNETINSTLLQYSVDKKKLDPTKLFKKGLEELDAALASPEFRREHIRPEKQAEIDAFRATLKKKWGERANLTRAAAREEIEKIALLAMDELGLEPTTTVMELACGACYAIDEYTAYLTPNQLRDLARSLAKSEEIGIGVTLAVRDSKIVVAQVAMDSPAFNAGLDIGDQILSVNKKAVDDLSLQAVKELLEGAVGSMVEVSVQSPGEANPRALNMVRKRAVVPSILHYPYESTPYYYLKINSFTELTAQDVDDAIVEMTRREMKGLILDLRDNNGGVFDSAIETARKFLSTGIIASTLHQDAKFNQVYHARNPKALALPLVVLVNGETASAAEVLAGALKDNERAYLIGQTTYGKGCTQCVLRLPKATGNVPTGGMRLTVARFFSPKGVCYSGRGVVPHFIIDDPMASSQVAMMGGPYFARAIDELNRMTMAK